MATSVPEKPTDHDDRDRPPGQPLTPPDSQPRAVAVAIPVKNEEEEVGACLRALDAAAAGHDGPVTVVALANDCTDGTVALLERTRLHHARLRWSAVALPPERRHAGWARRLALDAAAATLEADGDLLLSTDADTDVAPDWIARTVVHMAGGINAVAGRAFTKRAQRAALGPGALRRLNQLGRYYTALDFLRAHAEPVPRDPWPRHFYEGGASIALTLGTYRRIGGAPTPPVGEDRALFDRVRAHGGVVRHPIDVRVFTSCRLTGRAPGGMADTVAAWIAQGEDAPLHETYGVDVALAPGQARIADRLSFRTLPAAIGEAQARIRRVLLAHPQIEPVRRPTLGAHHCDRVAQMPEQLGDGVVAAARIVGLPRPVDEQEVAA